MGKKYDFTGETKVVNGVTLRRIRASKDFFVQAPCNTATEKSAGEATGLALVPKGTLGGWIEKRDNLSSKDSAWVADEACVWGDAQVIENGLVYGRAKVCDGTRIEKCGRVLGRAVVRHSVVTDQAVIFGNADITNGHFSEDANVYDDVRIGGDGVITVSGNGSVCGKAQIICNRGNKVFVHIGGEACVCELARIRCMGRREIMISGKAMVCDRAVVLDGSRIWDNASVCDSAKIIGSTVCGDAVVCGQTIVGEGSFIGGNARLELNGKYTLRPVSFISGEAWIRSAADYLAICSMPQASFSFFVTKDRDIQMAIYGHARGACSISQLPRTYLIRDISDLEADLKSSPEVTRYMTERNRCPELINQALAAADFAQKHFQRQTNAR